MTKLEQIFTKATILLNFWCKYKKKKYHVKHAIIKFKVLFLNPRNIQKKMN